MPKLQTKTKNGTLCKFLSPTNPMKIGGDLIENRNKMRIFVKPRSASPRLGEGVRRTDEVEVFIHSVSTSPQPSPNLGEGEILFVSNTHIMYTKPI